MINSSPANISLFLAIPGNFANSSHTQISTLLVFHTRDLGVKIPQFLAREPYHCYSAFIQDLFITLAYKINLFKLLLVTLCSAF